MSSQPDTTSFPHWSLYWLNYLKDPIILTALHLLHCRRLEYNDLVILLSNAPHDESIRAVFRYDDDQTTPLEHCAVRYSLFRSLTSGMMVLHYLYHRLYYTHHTVHTAAPLVQILGDPNETRTLLEHWNQYLSFGQLDLERYVTTAPATPPHLQNCGDSVELLVLHDPGALLKHFQNKEACQNFQMNHQPKKFLVLGPIPSAEQYRDTLIRYEEFFKLLLKKQDKIVIKGESLHFCEQHHLLLDRSETLEELLLQFDPEPPVGYDVESLHFINTMEQQPDRMDQLVRDQAQQQCQWLREMLLQAGLPADDPDVQLYSTPVYAEQDTVYEIHPIVDTTEICNSTWYKIYARQAAEKMQSRASFWDFQEFCDQEYVRCLFSGRIPDSCVMFGYDPKVESAPFDPECPLKDQLETVEHIQFHLDSSQAWYLAYRSLFSQTESEEYLRNYRCCLQHLPCVRFFEQFRRNLLAQVVGRGNTNKTKFGSDPLMTAWIQSVQSPIYSNSLRTHVDSILRNRHPAEVPAAEVFYFILKEDATLDVSPWLQLAYAGLGKKLFRYYVTDKNRSLRANSAYLVKPRRSAFSGFATETAEAIWNCLPQKHTACL